DLHSTVIADAEHEWIVNDHKTRHKERKQVNLHEKIITTKEMFDQLTFTVGKKHVNRWSITNTKPVRYPERYLPIDPYVLGCWLGDGHSHSSGFTCFDEEILENIKNTGETVIPNGRLGSYTIRKLSTRLRSLGLLGNKHIP